MFKRFRRGPDRKTCAERAAHQRLQRDLACLERQHQECLQQLQAQLAYRALDRAMTIAGMQCDDRLVLITLMNILIDHGWRYEPPKGDRPPLPAD